MKIHAYRMKAGEQSAVCTDRRAILFGRPPHVTCKRCLWMLRPAIGARVRIVAVPERCELNIEIGDTGRVSWNAKAPLIAIETDRFPRCDVWLGLEHIEEIK